MNIQLVIQRLLIPCFLVMLLSACATIPQPTTSEVATQFINSLNRDSVKVLISLSAFPFIATNQQWESAIDGAGFVLGKREENIFENKNDLSAYLEALTDELEIESVAGEYIPVTEYSRFHEELGTSTLKWESQDAFLFLRGMGDVEHIVMLGVDRQTKKVVQLYFN